MAHAFGDVLKFQSHVPVVHRRPMVGKGIVRKSKTFGESTMLKDRLLSEFTKFCGKAKNLEYVGLSWSESVSERWDGLNTAKSGYELGLLSWNVNGRLELRGCRESLLRRWALKGSVDVALIQEHFRKDKSPLFDLFGPDWWNISSGAIGNCRERKSGGCAIYGNPCLSSEWGFRHQSGRLCGFFTSGGLIVNIYFPTRENRQLLGAYREMFSSFVDEVSKVLWRLNNNQQVSWMICGADLNAHFAGSGMPPRRKDDYAASCLRCFMKKFDLISLPEEMSSSTFTFFNSRGGMSCVDSFLISRHLYQNGAVKLFEIVDFIEHGSDHSPIYLRVKVFPRWQKRAKKPTRRILKSSGFQSLQKKLDRSCISRSIVISKVLNFFQESTLGWSTAVTKGDMNRLWCSWIKSYNEMVEKLIGTRTTKDATWGRKFSPMVRNLCKEASVARSWFIKARVEGCNYDKYLEKWQGLRSSFIKAWEESDKKFSN